MSIAMPDQHFSRGWEGDPFVATCGCKVAPCGKVDGARVSPDCEQHNGLRTVRGSHSALECPGERHSEGVAS